MVTKSDDTVRPNTLSLYSIRFDCTCSSHEVWMCVSRVSRLAVSQSVSQWESSGYTK